MPRDRRGTSGAIIFATNADGVIKGVGVGFNKKGHACPFKGGLEKDESIVQGAVREVLEEASFGPKYYEFLNEHPLREGKTDRLYFIARAKVFSNQLSQFPNLKPEPGDPDMVSAAWIDPTKLLDPDYEALKPCRKMMIQKAMNTYHQLISSSSSAPDSLLKNENQKEKEKKNEEEETQDEPGKESGKEKEEKKETKSIWTSGDVLLQMHMDNISNSSSSCWWRTEGAKYIECTWAKNSDICSFENVKMKDKKEKQQKKLIWIYENRAGCKDDPPSSAEQKANECQNEIKLKEPVEQNEGVSSSSTPWQNKQLINKLREENPAAEQMAFVPKIKKEKEKEEADAGTRNTISRFLTKVLRHTAVEMGLYVRPDGCVELDSLLKLPFFKSQRFASIKIDAALIEKIVDENDKQRLMLTKETNKHNTTVKYWLCCVQGHSKEVGGKIDDKELLVPIGLDEDIPQCLHGTTFDAWKHIQHTGLSVMDRKHIHMAGGRFGEVLSGMRKNSQVLIYIDANRAKKDGVPFFRSHNDVILTPGIQGVLDKKYFIRHEINK